MYLISQCLWLFLSFLPSFQFGILEIRFTQVRVWASYSNYIAFFTSPALCALQIMTRSGLGRDTLFLLLHWENSPWLLSTPPAAPPIRNIHAGTRCFRPKLFCRTRPVTAISSGGGATVQTTSGIARNLEMSRGAPSRRVNREINTARATDDTQCDVNNRRATRHWQSLVISSAQQLELLFNLA